ncbi:MAG: PRC-barrel domain-containing protein [Anaerolineales bacterium]
MILKYGTDVVKNNGEKVGKVKEVVIDPRTDEVSHVILEKGIILLKDKVLPISLVEDVNEERVKLYPLDHSLDSLPDYEEEQFVEIRDNKKQRQPVAGSPPILITYPPVRPYPVGQHIKDEHEMRVVKKEIKNIPHDVQPIQEGEKVVTLDGHHIGDVERLILDHQTDKATHLIISEGVLLVEKKVVPVEWINEYDEDEIHLAVDRHVIENLPEYQREEKPSI